MFVSLVVVEHFSSSSFSTFSDPLCFSFIPVRIAIAIAIAFVFELVLVHTTISLLLFFSMAEGELLLVCWNSQYKTICGGKWNHIHIIQFFSLPWAS